MSKTYRRSNEAGWMRNPQTHGYRRDLLGAEEEIRSELGPNYLAGNFAEISSIPTAYDDLLVMGNFECLSTENHMINEFQKRYDYWTDEDREWYKYWVKFDTKCNIFRVGRRLSYTEANLVDYLPMSFSYKGKIYPVRILKHEWY